MAAIDFVAMPTDDVWIRDTGPVFVCDSSGRQAVVIVSDGLGDDLRDGSTAAAGYLFRRLVRPIPQHELLRIASYLKLGSTDDRSAVIVWL